MTVFQGWHNVIIDGGAIEPKSGRRYTAGGAIDHAGGCLIIFDAEDRQMVSISHIDLGSGIRAFEQVVKWAYDTYKPASIRVQADGVASIHIEALQSWGLPVRGVQVTARTYWNLLEDLIRAIRNEHIKLLHDDRLLDAMLATEVVQTKLAYKFYTEPDKSRGSIVALALAWDGVMHGGLMADFV